MGFPQHRPRRLRQSALLRRLVRETILSPSDLIYPLFVTAGQKQKDPIGAMPGQYRWSVDLVAAEVREVRDLGIPAVILFGIPDSKDETGTSGYDPNGVVQQAIRAIKAQVSDILVITDVCIDEYTSHGHCGIVKDGKILNDETLECLQRMARTHVEAGADIVAPSDMMDGRVGAIRQELDQAGFSDVPILSYAAKYASALYAPFRDAADSTPAFGDRRSYQMDPANAREAVREIALDIEEGADMIMVKPALPYLDVLAQARSHVAVPLAAYQVSGEYSQIKAAAHFGWIDEQTVMLESLVSIKRAGADMILTYFAKDAAALMNASPA